MNDILIEMTNLLKHMWEEMAIHPEEATRQSINEGKKGIAKINRLLKENPGLIKTVEYKDFYADFMSFQVVHGIHVVFYEDNVDSYIKAM